VPAEDGALIYIDAIDITYDANGNVSFINPASAQVAATEFDMSLYVSNSGIATSVGGAPVFTELSALEVDPGGGTFFASSGIVLPNLLIGWDGFSNDGGIVSTAGGGTIAQINGRMMGSTVATTGVQIGLLPDSTGLSGLRGLALRPETTPPVVVENYPRNLITSLPAFHRVEVASASPNNAVVLLFAIGPGVPGLAVPSLDLGVLGELFTNQGGTFFTLFPFPTDPDGFADVAFTILDQSVMGQAFNITFQVLDAGSSTLSTPAALHFL
jgi:hypothetical protein